MVNHKQPHPEEHRVAMRLEGWATMTVYPTLRAGPPGLLRGRVGLNQRAVKAGTRAECGRWQCGENVQGEGAEASLVGAKEVWVPCRFLIYRNRVENETDILVGRREDSLRRNRAGWLLARRKIILDQNVLLSKNLTFFI